MVYKVGDKVIGRGTAKFRKLDGLVGTIRSLPRWGHGKTYYIDFVTGETHKPPIWNHDLGRIVAGTESKPVLLTLPVTERNFKPFVDTTYDDEYWI